MRRSFFFLLKDRPNLVFGMGGYSSFPVCIAAKILKIPFIIPRIGIFVGFAFMAFYSSLAIYLMLRVGPDRYAEARLKARQKVLEQQEVA